MQCGRGTNEVRDEEVLERGDFVKVRFIVKVYSELVKMVENRNI